MTWLAASAMNRVGARSSRPEAREGEHEEVPLTPHHLTPIPLGRVAVEDEFWSPKLDVWRRVTLRDSLDKFERDGALDNFDLVAAGATSGHRNYPWFDGLVYEMIRAAPDFLATWPDP